MAVHAVENMVAGVRTGTEPFVGELFTNNGDQAHRDKRARAVIATAPTKNEAGTACDVLRKTR